MESIDLCQGRSPERMERNYEAMVSLVRLAFPIIVTLTAATLIFG